MKKIIITLLLIILVVVAVFIANKSKSKSDTINILTSFYPMYIATINITDGVQEVTVSNLTGEATGCVHDYVLSPQELVNVASSDIFVINGSGMEAFISKVVEAKPNLNVIDSSKGVEAIKSFHDGEEELDPHTYLNIDNYILQVTNIANGLAKLDPTHSEKYLSNMDNYVEKLKLLKDEFKDISQKKLVVVAEHNSFKYFANECLARVETILEHEEGEYPSSKEISGIVETIKNKNIKILIVDKGYNAEVAQTIKNEANIHVCQFDTCITGAYDKDSYINAMKENIVKINSAIMEVEGGQL